MSCTITNGQKICDSWNEAQANARVKNDIIDDIAGGVYDAANGFFHLPEDTLKYITGTDGYFGERRPWSKIGSSLSWKENPLIRAMEWINIMAYGGIDMVTFHYPNHILNEKMGMDIRYFSPVPTTTRGKVAEIVTFAGMLAGAKVLKVIKGDRAVSTLRTDSSSLKETWQKANESRLAKRLAPLDAGFVDFSFVARFFQRLFTDLPKPATLFESIQKRINNAKPSSAGSIELSLAESHLVSAASSLLKSSRKGFFRRILGPDKYEIAAMNFLKDAEIYINTVEKRAKAVSPKERVLPSVQDIHPHIVEHFAKLEGRRFTNMRDFIDAVDIYESRTESLTECFPVDGHGALIAERTTYISRVNVSIYGRQETAVVEWYVAGKRNHKFGVQSIKVRGVEVLTE